METPDREALLKAVDVLGLTTYQHWKGPRYLVLGLGHDANDNDRTAVVYLPLHPVDGPPFAIRTDEDFAAWVDPESGETTLEGIGVPRFRRLS